MVTSLTENSFRQHIAVTQTVSDTSSVFANFRSRDSILPRLVELTSLDVPELVGVLSLNRQLLHPPRHAYPLSQRRVALPELGQEYVTELGGADGDAEIAPRGPDEQISVRVPAQWPTVFRGN